MQASGVGQNVASDSFCPPGPMGTMSGVKTLHGVTARQLRQRTVTDGSCWLWTGNRHSAGHARLTIKGRVYNVHRLMYELRHGPIPANKILLRRCQHPHCINPGHYRLVTHIRMGRLLKQEGRYACGTRTPCARLRDADVKRIRRLHASGKRSYHQLAEEYGMDHSTIVRIVLRQRWQHVP